MFVIIKKIKSNRKGGVYNEKKITQVVMCSRLRIKSR